jgi:hypothetical protein
MAKTLRDAVADIVDARLRSGLGPLVRQVVMEVLGEQLGINGSTPRRGPGRPPKSPSIEGLIAAPAAGRGRRGKLTLEQKRRRAAEYQRQYRLRKKAEAAKSSK